MNRSQPKNHSRVTSHRQRRHVDRAVISNQGSRTLLLSKRQFHCPWHAGPTVNAVYLGKNQGTTRRLMDWSPGRDGLRVVRQDRQYYARQGKFMAGRSHIGKRDQIPVGGLRRYPTINGSKFAGGVTAIRYGPNAENRYHDGRRIPTSLFVGLFPCDHDRFQIADRRANGSRKWLHPVTFGGAVIAIGTKTKFFWERGRAIVRISQGQRLWPDHCDLLHQSPV